MREIGLKHIAEETRVSLTAVSRVLNDLPIRIGAVKKRKILAAAKRLHYVPNVLARGLRGKRTNTVGIVVPDITTLFYPELIRRIETELSRRGYRCLICNTQDSPALERAHMEDLTSRWVDALVIAPAAGTRNLQLLRGIRKNGTPMILVDRYIPGEDFDYVVSDNAGGAAKAVDILAGRGISNLVYLGEKTRNQALADRLEGVRERAARKGLIFTGRDTILTDTTREAVGNNCRRIFEKRPDRTGIFLESNRFLMGLLDAARENGRFIPDNLEVIGFDSFEPVLNSADDLKDMQVIRRPLPFLLQDFAKMAGLVNDYLLSSLSGEKKQARIKIPVTVKENICQGN